jgi:O-antigen ligase
MDARREARVTPLEIVSLTGFVVVVGLIFANSRLGILALLAFYPLLDSVPRLPLPGMNAETAVFGAAAAVTLMRFGPRLPPLRYSGPFLAFLAVMLMAWAIGSSIPNKYVGYDAWGLFKAWKAAVFPSFFFVFSYWWLPDEASRRRALEAITWSVGVIAASGLVDYLHPFTQSGLEGRAAGLVEQPNNLGGSLAAFSLAAIPLIRSADLGRLRRLLYLGIYLLALGVVVMTLSRGAWLGVIVGHAVLLLLARPAVLLAVLLAAAFALPSSYPLLPDVLRKRVEQTFTPQHRVFRGAAEEFGAGAERVVFYQIGLEMFADSPIWGHGLESFSLLSRKYGARYGLLSYRSPHSLTLRLAAETGLFGLTMLAWLGFSVASVGLYLWRRVPEAAWTGLILVAITASISASNLVHDSFLGHHVLGGTFWMLYGAAARALVSVRGTAPAGAGARPVPRWLAQRQHQYAPPIRPQGSTTAS